MIKNNGILRRYFKNKYSRSDYFKLKEMLLNQDPDLKDQMELHWDDFSHATLTKKKDLKNISTFINRSIDKKPLRNKTIKFYKQLTRIAAIFLIPVTLALGFLYFQFNDYLSQKDVYVEVRSPAGSRTTLNLPDGSSVWLNGNSVIKYPAVFNENRKVEMKGEAFFKVQSNKQYPFLVQAGNTYIKATGTEFNVSAEENSSKIRVILKEGKVEVLDKEQSGIKQMKAGYLLTYNEIDASMKYEKINTKDYSAWISGKLVFRNASLKEVVRRMEQWYGVNIEVEDKELWNLHFKATFIDEGIEEAIKLLQETNTLNYRFVKRKIKEDGSYEKTKIILSKK